MLVAAQIPAIFLFVVLATQSASTAPILRDRPADGIAADADRFEPVITLGAGRVSAGSGGSIVKDFGQIEFATPSGNVLSKFTFGYEASVTGATANDPLLDGLDGQPGTTVTDRTNIHLVAFRTPITPLEEPEPDEPTLFDAFVEALSTAFLALLAVSAAFAALMVLPRWWHRRGDRPGRQDGGHDPGPRARIHRRRHRSGKSRRRLRAVQTQGERSWP